MRFVGAAACGCIMVWACASGCATGTASGDDSTALDSGGVRPDASGVKDTGAVKDTGGTIKDAGTIVDTGGGNCGSGCLGQASTCCSNTCVDTTSDNNNCGACGNPCGSMSCCTSSCVDTMGTDNANCGGCGVICTGTCTNGTCQTGGGGCTISKGTCSHSPCTTGSALTAGCDANDEDLTDLVCLFFDPSCCTKSWTSTCVSYAAAFETNACMGSGC